MKVLAVLAITLGVCLAQRRAPQPQADNYEDLPQAPVPSAVPQQYVEQEQPHHDRSREHSTVIPIIRFDKEQANDGSYKSSWETGNNIIVEEEGFLKDLGPDPEHKDENLAAQVQQGSYTYTAPDGQVIVTNYIADERGFRVSGDHLPTPPPVSPEVQKGLDLIYAGIKARQEADAREAKEHPEQQRNQVEQEYQ